jgi:hypothetical protein
MPIIGSGKYRYDFLRDWAKLPRGWNLGETGHPGPPRTSVQGATAPNGDVYVLCRAAHPVLVFDPEGRFITSWGEGQFHQLHPLPSAFTAKSFPPPEFYSGATGHSGHSSEGSCLRRIQATRLSAAETPAHSSRNAFEEVCVIRLLRRLANLLVYQLRVRADEDPPSIGLDPVENDRRSLGRSRWRLLNETPSALRHHLVDLFVRQH